MGINMMLLEVDFSIHGIKKLNVFGHDVWITTTTISLLVVSVLILVFALFAKRALTAPKEVPSGFQNVVEMMYEALDSVCKSVMGDHSDRFINYIGTLFVFILFSNLSGLLGMRNPTADYGVTFPLGVFTFLMMQYQGIKNHKLKHFTALFEPTPVLFPINLIGEFANPLSTTLRLFANVLSGVIIMGLWYGMLPVWAKIGIPSALHMYFDVFSGAIQTYVFCMLTMVYVNDKL